MNQTVTNKTKKPLKIIILILLTITFMPTIFCPNYKENTYAKTQIICSSQEKQETNGNIPTVNLITLLEIRQKLPNCQLNIYKILTIIIEETIKKQLTNQQDKTLKSLRAEHIEQIRQILGIKKDHKGNWVAIIEAIAGQEIDPTEQTKLTGKTQNNVITDSIMLTNAPKNTASTTELGMLLKQINELILPKVKNKTNRIDKKKLKKLLTDIRNGKNDQAKQIIEKLLNTINSAQTDANDQKTNEESIVITPEINVLEEPPNSEEYKNLLRELFEAAKTLNQISEKGSIKLNNTPPNYIVNALAETTKKTSYEQAQKEEKQELDNLYKNLTTFLKNTYQTLPTTETDNSLSLTTYLKGQIVKGQRVGYCERLDLQIFISRSLKETFIYLIFDSSYAGSGDCPNLPSNAYRQVDDEYKNDLKDYVKQIKTQLQKYLLEQQLTNK